MMMNRAMSSPATKEQFLKQFEQIVESVKQNRAKASDLHYIHYSSYCLF